MNDRQEREERVDSDWLVGASEMLPCLSIRQPWAWLILHGGKDIENRNWATKQRGRVLVHAAKGMTWDEWGHAWDFAQGSGAGPKALERGLNFRTIERGGIVGSVEIADCVEDSDSRWFIGRYGFVLRDPQPMPFLPWKGALGFFGVPRAALLVGESVPESHMTPRSSHGLVSTRQSV